MLTSNRKRLKKDWIPTREFAKFLKENETKAEKALREKLSQIKGLMYKPQKVYKPIKKSGPTYIVDFWIPSLSLVIEVDGSSHNTPEARKKDKIRDYYINKAGHNILRLTNEEAITISLKDLIWILGLDNTNIKTQTLDEKREIDSNRVLNQLKNKLKKLDKRLKITLESIEKTKIKIGELENKQR